MNFGIYTCFLDFLNDEVECSVIYTRLSAAIFYNRQTVEHVLINTRRTSSIIAVGVLASACVIRWFEILFFPLSLEKSSGAFQSLSLGCLLS